MASNHMGLCASDQYEKLKKLPTLTNNAYQYLNGAGTFDAWAGILPWFAVHSGYESYNPKIYVSSSRDNLTCENMREFYWWSERNNTASDPINMNIKGYGVAPMFVPDYRDARDSTYSSSVVPGSALVAGQYHIRMTVGSDGVPTGYSILNGPLGYWMKMFELKGYVNINISTSTAAGTAAKTASKYGVQLKNGGHYYLYNTYSNTASTPTLNINELGAKAFYTADGNQITTNGSCLVKGLYHLYYNGSAFWIISGPIGYQKALLGI